jgi:hypothetical protein
MTEFSIEDVLNLIGGKLENHEKIDSGYKVEISEINKCAVDIVKDHDFFDYSHIETFYDEKAYYREIIFQISEPLDDKVFMVEGVYQRELEKEEKPNAIFEGIVLQVPSAEIETWKDYVYKDYAVRLTRENLQKFSDLSCVMRSIRSMKSPMQRDDYEYILKHISDLNREFSLVQKEQ